MRQVFAKSLLGAVPFFACAALFSWPAFADAAGDGLALVTKNCARCHATGATGDSPHKDAPPFRSVVTRYPLENLAEALAEGIVSGHPDMPEFVFPPDEIDAILSYLGKLKIENQQRQRSRRAVSVSRRQVLNARRSAFALAVLSSNDPVRGRVGSPAGRGLPDTRDRKTLWSSV